MQRGNSFTFLRLTFALAVVFAHSFAVGGFGADPLARFSSGAVNIGTIAVMCFFVVSGFLITGSALRQPSLLQFGLNRVARILPGFWAVQLLTVFVLAPAIMLARDGHELGYWESINAGPNSAMSYLLLNAYFQIIQYPITDLFLHNPVGSAVNGSLWSLAPEVICYVYLGLIALLGGLRWKFTGPVLFLVVYIYHNFALGRPELAIRVADTLENGWIFNFEVPLIRSVFLAFLGGMSCYQFRDALRWQGWMAVVAVLALAGSCWVGSFEFVWPFALPYLVLYLAHRLPFERVERWGDFSYGIYIYAFPLQQCLALAGWQRFGFLPFFGASTILAVLAGVVSWFALERPILQGARFFSRRWLVRTPVAPMMCRPELFPERN